MGSNMAENHPVGFQWVVEARERGAKVIHVDPRFTRTSAMATKWVGIRAGSDIAFLGGVVNYILENDLYFEEYVKHYTNAPVIIDEEFRDTEDLDGFFSGWNAEEVSTTSAAGSTREPRSTAPPGSVSRDSRRRGANSPATAATAAGSSTASRLLRTRRSSILAASSSC
jgi:formate dehydrogenase major subunit